MWLYFSQQSNMENINNCLLWSRFIKNRIIIMKINEETKVRNQGEISLITTIPKTYVNALNIKSGDILEWILDTEKETLELKIIK